MTPYAKPWQKTAQAGPEIGVAVFDPNVVAAMIKDAQRPVLVLGATSLKLKVGDKPYIEVLIDLARAAKLTVVATANSNKWISDNGITDITVYVMPLTNLTNRLEDDRAWDGLDGQGKPDLVIYGGITTYYLSQMLSVLKNFTDRLQTLTLDNEYQPNARFSLGNVNKDEWKNFLETLIAKFS
ncbi:MAG TPA: CO dehydrogenase/acetyl-CoA synthase complex subunit epsilon [Candidatus Lokiarchaeia archaeon]|nr:CO dehydrogenase/acetyl-CoA synthase complex subunit epsilon [Candidatus Lokiarchaeia archaeon]